MAQNFLELFIIEPKEGTTFHSPETKQDFQWILDQCIAGRAGISFSFRQSITHPNRLLFVSCWASKEDHDDLDLRGVTPKMLRKLMSRIEMPPIAVYYLLMDDEKRKEVELDAEVIGVTAWHVRKGCRGEFQKEMEKRGINGVWCVQKGVPPRPTVMPTDEVEVRIIEEGEKRAKARLEVPLPDIWVAFETNTVGEEGEGFGDAVKTFIEKVEGGNYGRFLSS
ncbi:hypothetical protein N431DRAFT_545882 [Stipitochalara longipes BDJ]|nr:hypothetical protein N431DRAFT_545882 [Stipitochalara longipes BDJ]